jgi:hypothetical protein
MIVESMNDKEFALEVVRDFLEEMRNYVIRAMDAKGRSKKRHVSNYISKRGNKWFLVYRPEYDGQISLHIKRPQPKKWFTWYSLILAQKSITLFGFNKHVADRISERYHPELTPTDALREMLVKTPAIIQYDTGKEFYTRVNGGVCIGSVYGKRFSIIVGSIDLQVDLRETSTFISDDLLYDNQKKVTEESIVSAINRLGKNYLSDYDLESSQSFEN